MVAKLVFPPGASSHCDPNTSATHHLLSVWRFACHNSTTERLFFGDRRWITAILVEESKVLGDVGFFRSTWRLLQMKGLKERKLWFYFMFDFVCVIGAFDGPESMQQCQDWKWTLYRDFFINSLYFQMLFFFLVWIRNYISLLTAAFKMLEVCVRGGDLPCSCYPQLRYLSAFIVSTQNRQELMRKKESSSWNFFTSATLWKSILRQLIVREVSSN